jgi:thiamine-phosphate pyrophosphorylase
MKPKIDLSVYLITDPDLCAARGLVETALAAVRGGATIVQLRDKAAPRDRLISEGLRLKQALAGSGVLLIVNDDVQAAAAIGADGVHVGQSDAAAEAARAVLGEDAVIGLSIQTQAHAAVVDPAVVDYVGVGPVFATPTKPDHARPLGFDGLTAVCRAAAMPAVAIGGLEARHAAAVFAAGADGLAVVSAICAAPDPEAAARAFALAARDAAAGQSGSVATEAGR